jgi:hypothetical protein
MSRWDLLKNTRRPRDGPDGQFDVASSLTGPRHCEERSDEAIQNSHRGYILDCFASLAMTGQPRPGHHDGDFGGSWEVSDCHARAMDPTGGSVLAPASPRTDLGQGPRHCEERSDEAIQNSHRGYILDCFASLAMTGQTRPGHHDGDFGGSWEASDCHAGEAVSWNLH